MVEDSRLADRPFDPRRRARRGWRDRSVADRVARRRSLFGGRVTADFHRQFDARIADAMLTKAGVMNAADRHIHVAVLRRAIAETAA
jgi:hypothetical protein